MAYLVALALISMTEISRTMAQPSSFQEKPPSDFIAVRDALRRGGLKEAAKLKGHYVGTFDPHWDFGLFDMEALTKGSSAVVVGSVVKKLGSRLAESGQLIFTDYEVVINETLKGVPTPGNSITLALIGGMVDFDDGTSAELRPTEFEHVKPGESCVLFLTESTYGPEVYTLTGGPQGLVQIIDDGTLKSHGRPTDPIALQTKDPEKGKTKQIFIREVRKDVLKWPGPAQVL